MLSWWVPAALALNQSLSASMSMMREGSMMMRKGRRTVRLQGFHMKVGLG
jgi:hypothetical protein